MHSADPSSAPPRRLERRDWLILIGIAFAVRALVAFVLLGDMPFVADAAEYAYEGRRLSSTFPGATPYFWPPGMPYLLAGVIAVAGGSDVIIRLITIVLSVLAVPLVVKIAGLVSDEPRVALYSGYVAALYMPDVIMAGQPYSQQLTTLCLAAFVYGVLKAWKGDGWGWWVLAGIALGAGSLTRPSMASVAAIGGAVLALAFVARPAMRRRTGRALLGGVIAVAVAAAILLPVMAFNAGRGAGWSVSTNNERNLFLGNNRFTPHYKTYHLAQRQLNTLEPEVQQYLTSIYTGPDPRGAMMRETLDYMKSNPGATLLRTANRVRAFWGFDYAITRQVQLHRKLGLAGTVPWLAIEAGGFVVTAALAAIGLIAGWRSLRRDVAWMLLGAVAAYQLPYALSFAAGGYHMPVMWLLMPFAGAALAMGWKGLWAATRQRRAIWLSIAAICVIQIEYAYFVLRSF
jgi:4-amino-4-deoxy-L-arabinose transferase-like glycosyltransferase